MPDISKLHLERKDFDSARLQLFSAEQSIARLEKEFAALEREADANNPEYQRRKKQLLGELEKAKATKTDKESALADRSKALQIEEALFAPFTDPTKQIEKFPHHTPFLLFPLRMEFCFKEVREVDILKKQLWVRAYPDTCLVDAFDPLLAQDEINNLARFWAEYHAVGTISGDPEKDATVLIGQKAAWQMLAKIHGSGRAAWISKERPLPSSIFPARNSEKTIILVIATPDADILMKKNEIIDFFKKIWIADGEVTKIDAIKMDFQIKFDPEEILKKYTPVNFNLKPPKETSRAATDLQVAIVLLPASMATPGTTQSSMQAPRVNLMPERLVLVGVKNGKNKTLALGNLIPTPLPVGFDPSAPEGEQFKRETNGDLELSKEISWISDFDQAVNIGMGFRYDLQKNEIDGFDRLFVLGVRLGADQKIGQELMEELFDHHFYSRKGLRLIPQGTPTNNTETENSGFSREDNPDETFDRYFNNQPGFLETNDPAQKKDGQWLAEWLGLNPTVFKKTLYSETVDQGDARAMNTALWPATLGYMMESMMHPVFSKETIDFTRQFFIEFVSGRGAIPSIRIGNQPYGILPTTDFSKLKWPAITNNGATDPQVINRHSLAKNVQSLLEVIKLIDADWHKLLPSIDHIGNPDKVLPEGTLLSILSLHPNSTEFFHRYLQSMDTLYSSLSLSAPRDAQNVFTKKEWNSTTKTSITKGVSVPQFDKKEFGAAHELLIKLGYRTEEQATKSPLLTTLYATDEQQPINVLIDTVPLSESKSIRNTYTADGKNYITALKEATTNSLDVLRLDQSLKEKPVALLYNMLKFALEQGYHLAAVKLYQLAEVFTSEQAQAARVDQPFIYMNWNGALTESRYTILHQKLEGVTQDKLVKDHITALLKAPGSAPLFTNYLVQQLEALAHLENASTARLERALVEHLDCCTYRLDTWKQGLVQFQLSLMRQQSTENDNRQNPSAGLYVGAYGWLEEVRPDRSKQLSMKSLPEEVTKDFDPDGAIVHFSDPTNAGFIQAPSLNQAVTAAVLRNGYLSNGKSDENSAMAINLSSERVRLALSVIEGMQNGQNLAALLGYQLERFLHDRDDLKHKGIDAYIYLLRKRFPLVADQLKDTKVENTPDPSLDPNDIPISAVEARNVVNGQAMVEFIKKQSGINRMYPYGIAEWPTGDSVIVKAITEAADKIMDIADAVADLAMAESVHQVVMGNYDRAAGVLETYSKGNYPQLPDVIRTPRSGATLTHRVGIPMEYIATTTHLHPRQMAEPTLDKWLSTALPALDKIVCFCTYIDRTDTEQVKKISLADLGMAPVDVLFVLNVTADKGLTELDDRIIRHIHTNVIPAPLLDANISIQYVDSSSVAGEFSVFEVMPLVNSLRVLTLQSAPLEPGDMALPTEAGSAPQTSVVIDDRRMPVVKNALSTLLTNYKIAVVDDFAVVFPDAPSSIQINAILKKIDLKSDLFAQYLSDFGWFGIPQTGFGSLYEWRREMFARLRKKSFALKNRWEEKLAKFNALEGTFNPAASDASEQLGIMERIISTQHSSVIAISKAIVDAKKADFILQAAKIDQVWDADDSTLSTFFEKIKNLSTEIEPFDILPLDIAEEEQLIVQYALNDLKPRATELYHQILKKYLEPADEILSSWTVASTITQKTEDSKTVAALIFGESFKLIPKYELAEKQLFELKNAWGAKDIILKYLQNTASPKYDFPEEDWLHGLARVREKMRRLENCIFLREAFELDESALGLHPVQLPYKKADYHWLGMPFPEKTDLNDGDNLLFTAWSATNAAAPTYVCGLRIDEWTEVIPLNDEMTGIAFHYDRPGSEAPQTMLLVTPPQLLPAGRWEWDDLVNTLSSTLDAAKMRALEPTQIDNTPYARYLPALVSPTGFQRINIMMQVIGHDLIKTIKN